MSYALLCCRTHLNSVATAAVTMATELLMMSFRWSSASARAVDDRFASALHRTYRNAFTSVAAPAVDLMSSLSAALMPMPEMHTV